jgi:hypothetical protein
MMGWQVSAGRGKGKMTLKPLKSVRILQVTSVTPTYDSKRTNFKSALPYKMLKKSNLALNELTAKNAATLCPK